MSNENLPIGSSNRSDAPWNEADDFHECLNCTEIIPDDKNFCSKWCKEEYDL